MEIHTRKIESIQDDWEEQLCDALRARLYFFWRRVSCIASFSLLFYFLRFGISSDGHYGLYLDDTLNNGSSSPCPTFDNEPLCSPGPKKAGTATVEFDCVGLEVWGMG
jgi:hypothetical protein